MSTELASFSSNLQNSLPLKTKRYHFIEYTIWCTDLSFKFKCHILSFVQLLSLYEFSAGLEKKLGF